jgi:hypothetical protein
MIRAAIVIGLIAGVPIQCFSQHSNEALYSRRAVSIWGDFAKRDRVTIEAPNQKSCVVASYFEGGKEGEHVDLDVSGQIGNLHLNIGLGVGAELLWAPDSRAFFVTTSDGGRNGFYRLLAIGQFEGRLESRELTELIQNRVGEPFRCEVPEPANVAGVGWVGQTHMLWAAAEVADHSNCDSAGTFTAYEVDPASMQIVRSLGQLDAKRELKVMLGSELKSAPDACIRKP